MGSNVNTILILLNSSKYFCKFSSKMNVFVIVCLSIILPIKGTELSDDWKTEFHKLSYQLEKKEREIDVLMNRIENKENDIELLKKKVESLEWEDRVIKKNDGQNYKFIAIKNEDGYISHGPISFDATDVNTGDVFNVSDGTFSVPMDGVYEFLFNGFINNVGGPSRDVYLYAYVNGEQKRMFIDNDFAGYGRQVTLYFSMELKENDQVYLYNEYASTYFCDNDQVVTFEGHLSHQN